MHGQADYAEPQGSEVSETETDRDKHKFLKRNTMVVFNKHQ